MKTVEQICELVNGRLVGDGATVITGVASLQEAGSNEVSFLGNKKYLSQVPESAAGAVFLPENYDGELNAETSYIYVKNPSAAFSQAIDIFAPAPIEFPPGIHSSAVVANDVVVPESVHVGANVVIEKGAVIGENTIIAAGCYIGHESVLGNNCYLHPNVTIRERCVLAELVAIHSGTVIGSDGFGYDPGANGHTKIPQIGIVQIDRDVEIGANVAIDRARFGKTWIQEGAKIDNLVHIAHNVVVGRYCFIVAQVGIAGSTVLGDGVIAAGQAGFSGHLTVGAGTTVMGQSGVTRDLKPKSTVIGTPAQDLREFGKQTLLARKVAKLEKKINELLKEKN